MPYQWYHAASKLKICAMRKTNDERVDVMTVEKVALVTAGGSGMGADAAKRLAADGFKLAILSSSGKGEALAEELGGVGVTGSNQSNDDIKRLVDLAMQAWSRIDVLVNSAGHGPRAPILDITDEDWHKGMDVYLMNVIRPTRIVTPIMQAQKSGAIVNISTAWVFEPSAMFPTSAVFRAGLASFTKIFADTYAADNIRMNNVLPGWIDSLPATEERRESVPMKRYGTSEEIAATVAFLASEGAGYITGQNIKVDGGLGRSV
jgi:NAD(P)-dependent dehydrogenase (short-subunit alcohol dehydrogenase family)